MNILETLLCLIVTAIETLIGILIIQRLILAGFELYCNLKYNKKRKSETTESGKSTF